MSNLFSGWEKDKLAVASTGYGLNDSDFSICDLYYQLGKDEKKAFFPFNLFQQKFESGILKRKEKKENNPVKQKKNNFRKTLVNSFFHPTLKYIGLYHCLSKIKLSDNFRTWLKNYDPDILYVQVTEREEILFANDLHTYLKIPMIIHVMDDWPSTISDSGIFRTYWHKKIDLEFKLLLSKASLLMSISDEMALEYKNRYGKKFITFHNPIDIKFWKQHQKSNYELSKNLTLLYAGRIGLGIDSSLKLVAKAIDMVNQKFKISMKFILQTKEKSKWFNNYSCIEHRSFVSYNDLPKKFSEADFLILPYDFSPKDIKFIKYSMPTKVPEYMITGTPIIIFSPGETAIVKYSKRFDFAEVVIENDATLLRDTIMYLIINKERRIQISEKAKHIAEDSYNSIDIRKKFKEAIISIC